MTIYFPTGGWQLKNGVSFSLGWPLVLLYSFLTWKQDRIIEENDDKIYLDVIGEFFRE